MARKKVGLFADYGGKDLGEYLAKNPVVFKQDTFDKAKSGDMDSQLRLATYYLSRKDCVHAEEWALKVFHVDKYYNGIEPVLDLLGMYQYHKQCNDGQTEL